MDTTGEQHLQIEHNIYKRRLDLDGKPIEDPKKTDISEIKKSKHQENQVMSYYFLNIILMLKFVNYKLK